MVGLPRLHGETLTFGVGCIYRTCYLTTVIAWEDASRGSLGAAAIELHLAAPFWDDLE